jgi:hypothetical protein
MPGEGDKNKNEAKESEDREKRVEDVEHGGLRIRIVGGRTEETCRTISSAILKSRTRNKAKNKARML